jgi:hypothetical protein
MYNFNSTTPEIKILYFQPTKEQVKKRKYITETQNIYFFLNHTKST